MAWIRSGYCCRCGECCVGDPGWQGEDPRGLMRRQPLVQGYCPLFEWKEGEPHRGGFCAGHEPPGQHPYYLSGCNVWPDDPVQIKNMPHCTYTFEWRDD